MKGGIFPPEGICISAFGGENRGDDGPGESYVIDHHPHHRMVSRHCSPEQTPATSSLRSSTRRQQYKPSQASRLRQTLRESCPSPWADTSPAPLMGGDGETAVTRTIVSVTVVPLSSFTLGVESLSHSPRPIVYKCDGQAKHNGWRKRRCPEAKFP